jgi:hypothetical protein
MDMNNMNNLLDKTTKMKILYDTQIVDLTRHAMISLHERELTGGIDLRLNSVMSKKESMKYQNKDEEKAFIGQSAYLQTLDGGSNEIEKR